MGITRRLIKSPPPLCCRKHCRELVACRGSFVIITNWVCVLEEIGAYEAWEREKEGIGYGMEDWEEI